MPNYCFFSVMIVFVSFFFSVRVIVQDEMFIVVAYATVTVRAFPIL